MERKMAAASIVLLTLGVMDQPQDLSAIEIDDLLSGLPVAVACMGFDVPDGDMNFLVSRLKQMPGRKSRGMYPDFWIGEIRKYAYWVIGGGGDAVLT